MAKHTCLQVRMEHDGSFLKTLTGALLIAATAFGISYRSGDPWKLLLNLSTPHSGEEESSRRKPSSSWISPDGAG